MKITYEFVNGEISEIEVSDEIGEFITAARREEESSNRRYNRHIAFSLNGNPHNIDEVAIKVDLEDDYLTSEQSEHLYTAMNALTETERRWLEMYADGLSYREIARQDGTYDRKVSRAIERALKKILKNF